jgi:hypothetical protein
MMLLRRCWKRNLMRRRRIELVIECEPNMPLVIGASLRIVSSTRRSTSFGLANSRT